MIGKLFGKEIGWRRYSFPRTGYVLFGSGYFFLTCQFTLFVAHLALEALCVMFWSFVAPSSAFAGLFLSRLVVPLVMERYPWMNQLEGAYKADWILPIVFIITTAPDFAITFINRLITLIFGGQSA